MRRIATTTLIATVAQRFIRTAKGGDGKDFTVIDLTVANDATVNGRTVTSFIEVSLTGKRAEFLKDRLEKGVHLMIAGEPSQDRWTDNQGARKSRFKVKAHRVEILEGNHVVTDPDKKGLRRLKNGINTTTIAGNVTGVPTVGSLPRKAGEPEVKYVEYGVALNSKKRDAMGNETDEKVVSYINVRAWREDAERAAAELTKGTPVTVSGGLMSRSWTDAEGKYQSSTWLETGFASALSLNAAAEEQEAAMTEADLPPVTADMAHEDVEAELASA